MGKLGAGLDGILTLIPAVGGVYGLGVGGFLLVQAHRARASRGAMLKMATLLGADALLGEIPLIGDAFDFFFRAHARAANTLLRDIERTHYAEESTSQGQAAGRLEGHRAEMRSQGGKRRLVFLGD